MRFIFVLFCSLWFHHLGAENIAQLADSLYKKEAYEEATRLYAQLARQELEKGAYSMYLHWTVRQARGLQAVQADQKAIGLLDSALQMAKDKVQEDTLIADVYHRMGVSLFRLEEVNFEPAIVAWQRALEIRQRFSPPNHIEIIRAYCNIGTAFANMQQQEIAAQKLLKSLDLHLTRAKYDTLLLARTHRELGMAFARLRDFDQAVLHTEVTHDLYKIIYRDQPWRMGAIYESLVVLYTEMNDIELLFFSCREAIKLYEAMEEKWDDDYWKLADFYSNLGFAYELVDDLEAALNSFQRSMDINRQYPEKRQGKLAINLSNLSLVYLKLKRYDTALQMVREAIKIDKQIGNPVDLAANVNNLAAILWKMGDYEEALLQQQQAIRYIVPDFAPQDVLQHPPASAEIIGKKSRLIDYLHDKAIMLREWADLGELEERLRAAADCYTIIASLIDQMRTTFESDESKEFLQAEVRNIFDVGIAICHDLYQLNNEDKFFAQALDLTERSKAMVLLEGLQEAQALLQTGVPDDLIQKEALIKSRIDSLQAQLFMEVDADAQTQLRTDLVAERRSLDRLLLDLQANAPEYFAVKYDLSTVSTEEITSLMGEATMIEYIVMKDMVYAFVIQASDKKFLRIPYSHDLQQQIANLREHIGAFHLSGLRSDSLRISVAEKVCHAAFELYQMIFAPIVQAVPLSKKLIIIPDDVLGYIPFELLLREKPQDPTLFAAHDYLIKDHQISYSYSISLWKKMLTRTYGKKRPLFFGMAPAFVAKNQWSGLPAVYQDLNPLTYNEAEVTYLGELLDGQIYSGIDANKDNFLDEASQYRIIHLATHGRANDKVGDYAFLAFTGTPDSTDNELLYNRELYNLYLQADMVVLSACETGIGELQRGEGIISLARGFTYAGAKSIITTLWSINDDKSEDLMQRFYGYLKKGRTKDAALHQAKLDFIENLGHDAHPYYWAAFIPIGDMSKMNLNNGIPVWVWVLLGVALIAFFSKSIVQQSGKTR